MDCWNNSFQSQTQGERITSQNKFYQSAVPEELCFSSHNDNPILSHSADGADMHPPNLASSLKVLIIQRHTLFKDKCPYLLRDWTPTCFYIIVLKTNERQFLYIRPEVSALFSFQIVNRDLNTDSKVAWECSP